MYTPDRSILRKLREYDPRLNARWNRNRERWEVTYDGDTVITVVNDDGSYRPLDERILITVALGDSHRMERRGDAARLVQQNNRAIQRKQMAATSDLVQQTIKEDWRQISGAPIVQGWAG